MPNWSQDEKGQNQRFSEELFSAPPGPIRFETIKHFSFHILMHLNNYSSMIKLYYQKPKIVYLKLLDFDLSHIVTHCT